MNKRPRWDEQKVEKHLNELPTIKDHQSKDELFEAIQKRMGNNDVKSRVNKRKVARKNRWFFPSIASAAALFILLLIVPSFIGNMGNDELSSGDNKYQITDDHAEMDTGDTELATENDVLNNDDNMGIAVDDGDIEIEENEEEFAIEKMEMDVVAIPFVEDVETSDGKDFYIMVEGIEKTDIDEVVDSREELLLYIFSEKDLVNTATIDDLQAVIIDDHEKAVTLDFVENNRLESLASAESKIYHGAIREVLGMYGFEKVHFTTNGEPGVMIGQTGLLDYSWDLPFENRGYYYYKNNDGKAFYIRGVAIGEWSLEEEGHLSYPDTLERMKEVKEGAWYEPTIPESVHFDGVIVEGNEARITISEDSTLEESEFDKMIKAISLAASDFNLEYVSISGGPIESIGERFRTMNIPVDSIPMQSSSD